MKMLSEITRSGGILQIHWTFPPTTGGVESHVADLAAAMARRDRRVVVLTGEQNPIRSNQYAIVSTALLDLKTIKAVALPAKEFLAQFGKLLAKIIFHYGIGTIHGHNLHHFHSAPAVAIDAARRQLGLSVFHTFHETWPDLLRETPVYRSWNGNFAVSRHVQEQCQTVLGFSPTLYPLGVDTSTFKSGTECLMSDSWPIVLHPARLLPWKGVDISIRALRLLLDRGYRITLVVTDTQRIADWNDELAAYRAKIVGLIDELHLSQYVRFERAAYADMPPLYEKADIVVYPTVGDEPYGLVPIEAMSCARPIVASNSGGIVETIIDGVTGYIVPKGDVGALADGLGELISNPHLARRFGGAGRRRVKDHFDSERYVSTLLREFAQI